MIKPLVSVIMPAYNAGKFLDRSVKSILNQTYDNIELLIADDASKDNTSKLINSFTDPRVKRFHNDINIGYLKTCNNLFRESRGQYLAFQDADDYSVPERLEIQLKAFSEDKNLGACGSDYISLNDHGKEFLISDFPYEHDKIKDNLTKGNFSVMPNSFLFKKELLDTIGGYNIFFDRIGAEDYYWTWLIMEKYKLVNIKKKLYYYQYHPNSITGFRYDNHMKYFSSDLVVFLISQRLKHNSDGLDNDMLRKELDDYIELKELPFRQDPSFLYRNYSIRDFYNHRKKRALLYALKAFRINPRNPENFKNFIYFLKNLYKNENINPT